MISLAIFDEAGEMAAISHFLWFILLAGHGGQLDGLLRRLAEAAVLHAGYLKLKWQQTNRHPAQVGKQAFKARVYCGYVAILREAER